MSTLFHTVIRPALAVTITALMSTASLGANVALLPSTTLIKPVNFNISDLVLNVPTTETAFTGQELLDSIGRYKSLPMTYSAVELDKDPVAKSIALLKRLNVKFNTDRFIPLNDKWFGFQSDEDPSAIFELDSRTGNVHFNAGLKRYNGEESTPNLPKGKEETIQFAAQHLINLELLPPLTEINLQKIELGGLNMAIPDGQGRSKVFEKLKTVRAYRVLNGLEVEGDSRIVMNIGEKGALAGVVFKWPKVGEGQALTENDLIPAVKIREAALSNIQRVIAKTQNPELKEVKLVLYDDGQGIIEPAYHFIINRNFNLGTTVRATELTMIPFDFYLPILNKSRAVFPDMESVRVQPLDGIDEKQGNVGKDE